MKNFLHKFWPFLTLLIFAGLTAWPLFLPGYFSHHDDLQVMRIFEMRKCLVDYQIPCRWVPDMGYGNGYPLFNYYGILPYYIGALVSFLTGFLVAAKLLFLIPIILSGFSMYFFARQLGGVYPSLVASALYVLAPYKALDTYVRGDVTENFAMALMPLGLYFGLKLIKNYQAKFFIGFVLSLTFFLLSHNIMTVLFVPVAAVLFLFWLKQDKFRNWKIFFAGLILAIGLAAFFILPAYFEKDLVQIDNLTRLDLDFRAHFVTLKQLFLGRNWGYGASIPGPNDTISFQIGWPHWWMVIISVIWVLAKILKEKNIKGSNFYLILLAIFILSVFMTHARSAFIWERIPLLRFTQFPWRFLAITSFSASLLSALFLDNFKGKIQIWLSLALIAGTIFLNWNYFKPEHFYPDMTDAQKLSGELWEDQQKAAILDYLPISAVQPRERAPSSPILRSGDAGLGNFNLKSNQWSFETQVKTVSEIEVPVFDFPGWKVWVNGEEFVYSNKNYLGRISLKLEQGNYLVEGKFLNTGLRAFSNLITIASAALLLIYVKRSKNNS